MTESNNTDVQDQAAETLRMIGRRSLLKTLAKAGGVAATASLLPSEWVRPVLDLAVVPAHAQMSGQQEDRTILSCEGDVGQNMFYPGCTISPAEAGVSMTLTILINGTPVGTKTAITDAGGYASLVFDPYAEFSWNGVSPMILRWSFTNPLDGQGTCEELFQIRDLPS